MPQVNLSADEKNLITIALGAAISSAMRQQHSKRQPEIQEVYLRHEKVLRALYNKIQDTK